MQRPGPFSWGGRTGVERRGRDHQAAVQTGPSQFEVSITPGNVIDFNMEGKTGWIGPQRADATKNIALGILGRNGRLAAPTILESGIEAALALMVDNNGETAFERKSIPGVRPVNPFGAILDFDLGARFGVNRIQFFPRNGHPDFPAADAPFQNDFIRAYEVFLNDGSEKPRSRAGRYDLTKIGTQDDEPVVDLRIPPSMCTLSA